MKSLTPISIALFALALAAPAVNADGSVPLPKGMKVLLGKVKRYDARRQEVTLRVIGFAEGPLSKKVPTQGLVRTEGGLTGKTVTVSLKSHQMRQEAGQYPDVQLEPAEWDEAHLAAGEGISVYYRILKKGKPVPAEWVTPVRL